MTKTISLADDAYDDLVAVRRANESFSELARRLAKEEKRRRLLDRALQPLMPSDEAEAMIKQVRKWRDETLEPRHR